MVPPFSIEARKGVSWAEGSFAMFAVTFHAAAAYIVRHGNPTGFSFPNWFRGAFGIPSPTSGTTRAFYALHEGAIGDMFAFNAAAALVILFSVVFVPYLLVSMVVKRYVQPARWVERATFWFMMGVLVLGWLAKIAWLDERYW